MDATKTPVKDCEGEGSASDVESFPTLDLRTLLPKCKVSRSEYRRKKKSAKRKINRQFEAKINLERESILHETKEYQEKMAEIEKDYKLRKEQWEAKEAKYAREMTRRKEIEAVLKAQLSASLGKHSVIEPKSDIQLDNTTQTCEVLQISSSEPIQVIKETEISKSKVTLVSQEPCILFQRTGSCRSGPSCKWAHCDVLTPTQLLIFPHMFSFPEGFPGGSGGNIHDGIENIKALVAFNEFFEDVFPELNRFGGVQDVKVSLNTAPHLRGNVYALFSSSEAAQQVFDALKGRFYGGMTLLPRYLSHSSLKQTLCGKYERNQKCDTGQQCNYVHAFITPIFKDKPIYNLNDFTKASLKFNASRKEQKEHYGADIKRGDDSFIHGYRVDEKHHRVSRHQDYKRHSSHETPTSKRTKDQHPYSRQKKHDRSPRSNRCERSSQEYYRHFKRNDDYTYRHHLTYTSERQGKSSHRYGERDKSEKQDGTPTKKNS